MRKLLLLTIILLINVKAFSQTDTAFWFAAPDISSSFNYDRPIVFRISAYQIASTVTVSQPANPSFTPITITLSPFTTQTVDLTSQLANIECGPGDVIQNRGLKVKSNNNIAVYYEVNVNGPNPELFALKGKNALGTQFYITSQNFLNNSNAYTVPPLSSFNIVASEDNTSLTIIPSNNITGHAGGTPFTIILNRGQTYAAIASSQAAAQHLGGSKVTSTKPIAITLADDLLEGGTTYGGGCQDLAGDQTVPINVLGLNYIAIRSNLSSPYDKINVIAIQNGTSVTQDGVLVSTLNAGQGLQLPVSNPTSYIQASNPIYAFQLAGYGCEVGSALLPQIDCTGSGSVSVARSSNESLYITLLVKSGGQGGFLINNLSGVITAGQFNPVPNTSNQFYYAKILLPLSTYPNGSVIKVDNTTSLFQMGFAQGDVSGLSYGYFSDYNTITANATANNYNPCVGANVNLSSTLVPSAVYSWTGPGGYTSGIANPTLTNLNTGQSGDYIVSVTVPGCGTYKDTVTLNVISPVTNTVTQSICQGQNYLGYTISGNYIDHFTSAAGCDSARTLNLTVKPKSFTTVNQSICEGQTFGGHNAAGTYVTTLVAANGCDSIVTLNLTIRPKSFTTVNQSVCEGQTFEGHNTAGTYITTLVAANGCDSVVTLNLIIKPKLFTTVTQTVCEGQSVEGHTVSGTYVSTFVAANGCDSIHTLNLTVKPKSITTFNIIICEGQSYSGYTTSGTYVDTYVAANNCDSIRTLNLTVKPKSFTTSTQTVCEGQVVEGHTTTGTYVTTLVAANGCDSIHTLNLTVRPKSFTTVTQTVCEGQLVEGHATSGTYVSTFLAANGCDSIHTLNLTVNPKSLATFNIFICEGQNYAGYTTSGTYVDTYVAANGCDSIRTLNLTVKLKTFSVSTQTVCEGQVVEGHTTTGTYMSTFIGSNGCDSIHTLNLTIKPKSFTNDVQSVCEGQVVEGHTTSGTYVTTFVAANGCDSVRTLTLTVKPKSFATDIQTICEGQAVEGHTTTGTYVGTFIGSNGCDSIHTLILTVKPRSFSNVTAAICSGDTYAGHNAAGTYTDTYVAANGCDSIRTLTLTVKQKAFTTTTQIICEGQSIENHYVSGTYVSTFSGSNGCDSVHTLNLTVKPKSTSTIQRTICKGQAFEGYTLPGTYLNTFTAANGCDSVRKLILTVQQLPVVNLGRDTAICAEEKLTLSVNGLYSSYLWQDGSQLSTYLVSAPGIYAITVSNNCGTASDQIVIGKKDCVYYFPNVFSPNGDKHNDIFKILTVVGISKYNLTIYNRWGEKVFETNKLNEGWDGLYKNKPAMQDNYIWYSKFNKGGRAITISGSVILLR